MEMIAVLGSGERYCQMIARQVRACQVYSEILPLHTSSEDLRKKDLKGLIIVLTPGKSGDEIPFLADAAESVPFPVLIVGYSGEPDLHQNIRKVIAGNPAAISTMQLFRDLGQLDENAIAGWSSFRNSNPFSPSRASAFTTADNVPLGWALVEHKRWWLQLHPEFFLIDLGQKIIDNFATLVCDCTRDWTMDNFIQTTVEDIRRQVGSAQVICGLSGGVDSSVAAILVNRAVGDQLTCIYVDHGFMRKQESEQVINMFSRDLKINLVPVDAGQRFLSKVAGVVDPEQKRKLIGTEFIRVFEEEAHKLGKIGFLVQGTLYSDVIESGIGSKNLVKSHHNVGGLPDDVEFEIIEPLKALFKDEIRALAGALGLPGEIIWRHPFPGPGLAIRIIGEVTEEKLAILREVDAIFIEEIRKANLYRDIWQAFAVLTNTRTVGVTKGQRTYDYVVVLRAVVSEDGMAANWVRMPYTLLQKVSERILHEVQGVNRVTYDISAKPPATIEWE